MLWYLPGQGRGSHGTRGTQVAPLYSQRLEGGQILPASWLLALPDMLLKSQDAKIYSQPPILQPNQRLVPTGGERTVPANQLAQEGLLMERL